MLMYGKRYIKKKNVKNHKNNSGDNLPLRLPTTGPRWPAGGY